MVYDYLIVGTGLFGSVFAYEAAKRGHSVKMLEKRAHIGGNCYTEKQVGIDIHKYGAHIFHTSSKKIWDYVNQFADFYPYIHEPIANYKGELYNLPFNMNTFYQLWGTKRPDEARIKLMAQIEKTGIKRPRNLEEQALSLVGTDIYHKLIKGYTENSGDEDVLSYLLLLLKDCRSGIHLTTIILRILFKAFPNWAIQK